MAENGDLVSYENEPAVLVFGSTRARRDLASAAVAAAGGRVGAALPIEEAIGRLETQASLGAVIVDVTEDAGAPLDLLLDRLDEAARTGRHPSLVIFTPDLIDIIWARAVHIDVDLRCDPCPVERAAATGMLLAARRHRLHDIGAEQNSIKLRHICDEVGRIARRLATISGNEHERLPPPTLGDRRQSFTVQPTAPIDAGTIRAMIRGRRLREQYFDRNLFADPAWDMLLDLMAARLERRPVAVSSLCIAAAVPQTTALRWTKRLTQEGIVSRADDPHDGRRVFVELTDQAANAMMAYLTAAQRTGAMML